MKQEIKIGSIIRPAADGIDRAWTKLRGTVLDIWNDAGELRAEVRWHQSIGERYGTRVPVYLLTLAPAE